MPCVFCDIVSGTEPSHTVLEDEHHVAFLSIFPNTPGFTVVIPKKHASSDVLSLDDKTYTDLLLFTKKVDKVLRRGLQVDRCALIVEGMMVSHAHTKLVPLHGLDGRASLVYDGVAYSEKYEGYVTSIDGPRKSDEELAATLAAIHQNPE
ncbi:HIT-like protein [Martensiomyces pterosporus]|nr:HIT-like protein [Martensiomyces pterosporus]